METKTPNFDELATLLMKRNGFDLETAQGVADLLVGKWCRMYFNVTVPPQGQTIPRIVSVPKGQTILSGGGGSYRVGSEITLTYCAPCADTIQFPCGRLGCPTCNPLNKSVDGCHS